MFLWNLNGKVKEELWVLALAPAMPRRALLCRSLGRQVEFVASVLLLWRLGCSSAETGVPAWLPTLDRRLSESRATSHLSLNPWKVA